MHYSLRMDGIKPGENQLGILVVDDEPDIREFISYNLLRKGYKVYTAADGKTGYELAVLHKPRLVILDILMPVVNGYDTCIRIRKNPMLNDTRIIFLSALTETYAKEIGIRLEADDYISKPIRIEKLVRRIEMWVKG
jgi:two-component system, OmpR family, alkaline phosphatase synthesis response regulator PhoP